MRESDVVDPGIVSVAASLMMTGHLLRENYFFNDHEVGKACHPVSVNFTPWIRSET